MKREGTMSRVLLLTVCLLGLCWQASAQRPPWLRGEMPVRTNDTYYFRVVSGEGRTPSEARHAAMLELVGDLARAQGVTVRGSDLSRMVAEERDGTYSERTETRMTYRFERGAFRTRFEVEDEHHEGQTCWLLVEVAVDPERVTFDPVELTTDYKGSALWRSLIIPGWGQMHKRNTGRGMAILTLTAAGATGIVVCHNQSNTYYNKALSARNSDTRESYEDKSSTYRNARNACIAATAVVYVWNVVDALTGKGAKRYAKPDRRLSWTPYMNEASRGIALSFKL